MNCLNILVQDKGDFLALIQRNQYGDKLLATKLRTNWNKNGNNSKYKLLDFQLNLEEVRKYSKIFDIINNPASVKSVNCQCDQK